MASTRENFNVKILSRFDGLNFPLWKIKMKVFLNSLGMDVSLFIEIDFKEFNYVTDPWYENISKAYKTNAMVTYALMQPVMMIIFRVL